MSNQVCNSIKKNTICKLLSLNSYLQTIYKLPTISIKSPMSLITETEQIILNVIGGPREPAKSRERITKLETSITSWIQNILKSIVIKTTSVSQYLPIIPEFRELRQKDLVEGHPGLHNEALFQTITSQREPQIKTYAGAGEMVKALSTKPDNQVCPWNYMVKDRTNSYKQPTDTHICTDTYTWTYIVNKQMKILKDNPQEIME